MSGDTQVVVVALIGGVGGALLTGIFNAIIGVIADGRKKQQELDAWLREKRFEYFNEVMTLARKAPTLIDPAKRQQMIWDIDNASIPLQTVAPRQSQDLLRHYKSVMADELRQPVSERSTKAMSWEGGRLQATFSLYMGWDQEPMGSPDLWYQQGFIKHMNRSREEGDRKIEKGQVEQAKKTETQMPPEKD